MKMVIEIDCNDVDASNCTYQIGYALNEISNQISGKHPRDLAGSRQQVRNSNGHYLGYYTFVKGAVDLVEP